MRLTNSMRDDIVARVLKFKFEATEKALELEGRKLFDKVYDLLLGANKKTFESLPSNWFPATQNFLVEDGRHACTLTGEYPRPIPERLPQAFDVKHHRTRGRRVWSWEDRSDEHDAVFELVAPHIAAHVALDTEREALQAKLKALVYSVTSDTKLYELWPELAEVVPVPEDTSSKGTALTVSIKELNNLIPLPSKKEPACSTSSTKTARRAARKTSGSGAQPSATQRG